MRNKAEKIAGLIEGTTMGFHNALLRPAICHGGTKNIGAG